MINYEIDENSSLALEDKYISIVRSLILENPSLQLYLDHNKLHFPAYTVGEIRLDDILITIKPRNPSLSLGTIFELAAFVNISSFISDIKIPKYAYKAKYGISSLSDNYLKCLRLLIQFGLTGKIFEKRETTKYIKGRLVMDKFNLLTMPQNGLESMYKTYSLNTKSNQIIKTAIEKLLFIETDSLLKSGMQSVLRDFDSVDRYEGELNELDTNTMEQFSANPYYPITLQYAIIILKNLKMSYSESGRNWHAFLENSNDLFEKYVLKTLKNGMKEKVEKWEQPKQYATIRHKDKEGYKYFNPDILVDYDEKKGRSRMVLDAKNKKFTPSQGSFSEIVQASDIYQILFYCKRLRTNLGGLIYPTNARVMPIQLMVDNETEIKLFLFSINMLEDFDDRASLLVKDVSQILAYS